MSRFGVPTVEELVARAFATEQEEDERGPGKVTTSIRIDAQALGELEELAGELDLSRSELTRQIVEIGIADLREALDRAHAKAKKTSPVKRAAPVKKGAREGRASAG